MNIPNLISLGRLLSVPLTVWLILDAAWVAAFALFLAAGVSDAIDGYIAKRYDLRSELGRFLDPLADKALLVSIYVTLGLKGILLPWIVILVVSRDVLIVGGVLLSFAMGLSFEVQPSPVSKLNTVMQITLAAAMLGQMGLHVRLPWPLGLALVLIVAVTTVLSGAGYLIDWGRAQASTMNDDGGGA